MNFPVPNKGSTLLVVPVECSPRGTSAWPAWATSSPLNTPSRHHKCRNCARLCAKTDSKVSPASVTSFRHLALPPEPDWKWTRMLETKSASLSAPSASGWKDARVLMAKVVQQMITWPRRPQSRIGANCVCRCVKRVTAGKHTFFSGKCFVKICDKVNFKWEFGQIENKLRTHKSSLSSENRETMVKNSDIVKFYIVIYLFYN